MRMFFII